MQVYDDDLLVGFIHLVYFEDVVYLYYLAIEPDERGQGMEAKSCRHYAAGFRHAGSF